MKTYLLAATAVALMSSSALALPAKSHKPFKPGYQTARVTFTERAAIARSQANLNALKRRIHADGRVTTFERMQLRLAEARHSRLVAQARRS
jgi:hypothetical protein